MNQQQIQLDIYFQGTKDELYALIFPITGTQSPVFDHLELNQVQYDKPNQQIELQYETKDFKNIDRQKQPIKYASTSLQSKSNYFYSYQTSEGLVWRNISKVLQMRPQPISPQQQSIKENKSEMVQQMEEQKEKDKIELYRINEEDEDNKVMEQIKSAPSRFERNENNVARRNWDMSEKQYFMRLFQ